MTWAARCAIAVLGCCASAASAAAPATQPAATLKDVLRERVDGGRAGTCIVAGIVDATGQKVVSYGRLDGASTSAVADGQTVFEIGSATKTFTGLLLADMVERGEVRLDDPVARLLPASVKVPQRNGRQITLLDLATHTSGLPRLPDNLAPRDPSNPYADYTPVQMYAFLSEYALSRDIGSQFEYSNLGVGLLGHALALKLGTNYESAVVRRICTPLGMSETRITLTPQMKARLAPGHDAAGKPVGNWDLAALAGAGAIRSTANDLLKYVAANAGLTHSDLSSAMTLARQPRHGAGAPDTQVGLCWHISARHGKTLVWHNGQTGGYHSFIGFDPAAHAGAVVLTNAGTAIDDIGFHLLDPDSPMARPGPPTTQGVAIHVKAEVLDQYVGKYEMLPGVFFNIRRDGQSLQAQLTGQPYFEVFPESEARFFYKAVDAQLTFVKDEQGAVSGLVLHQNGIDQTARKVSSEPPAAPARHVIVKLDPKVYEAYVGEYELAPGAVFTIRREGDRLLARLTGQEFAEIFPESTTEFFYKSVDARITFVKDDQRRVTALVLHQNGRDMEAKRLK